MSPAGQSFAPEALRCASFAQCGEPTLWDKRLKPSAATRFPCTPFDVAFKLESLTPEFRHAGRDKKAHRFNGGKT